MINHREFTIAYLGLRLLRYDSEPFALRGILPNIRRKNHRDIDGTLGTSALRFEDIALCVAKPLESSVLVCRHTSLTNILYKPLLAEEKLCKKPNVIRSYNKAKKESIFPIKWRLIITP